MDSLNQQQVPRKEPGLAIIMSIFVPFSGHIYAGRMGRALLGLLSWAFFATFGLLLVMSPYKNDYEHAPFVLLIAAVLWFVSIFTAGGAVKNENQRNGYAG